jgi:hypothetical protein
MHRDLATCDGIPVKLAETKVEETLWANMLCIIPISS